MNYQKMYNRLIDLGKENYWNSQDYFENHHILPRSEGGSNKKTNKVALPPKVHHLCHLLLIKMHLCMKYCYFGFTMKEYVRAKMIEKKKKHLL